MMSMGKLILIVAVTLVSVLLGMVNLLGIHKCFSHDAHPMTQRDNQVVVSCSAQALTPRRNLAEFIDAVFEGLNAVANGQRPIQYVAMEFDKFNPPANGHWTEFGVFEGLTLSSAHSALKKSTVFNGTVAGFDSFLGLPSEWRSGYGEGQFTADYTSVRRNLPDEIKLYKGWFQDTIDGFLRDHPGPMALIHHDADLFVSTAIAFQMLSHRIVPGTILCFDELVGYPGYEKHEILSFFLWMHQYNAKVCPIAFLEPYSDEMRNVENTEIHGYSQSACFQVMDLQAKNLADQ